MEVRSLISLIVAAAFIIFGFILKQYPPKSINDMYGYRTPMSTKNQDTWDVAQKYGGFSMMIVGFINGILGIWSIIQPLNINNKTMQLLFLVITSIGMIIWDEIYLMKVFNKDGSRKI
jgi:uncharacterized membrane protein